VTATKLETPATRLGASVTVITEEELKTHGYQTVGDALRQTPGVDIQRQGSLGKNTLLRIRGAGPDSVQVLVDGMRVKSASTGDFNFALLSVDEIERIEIVRGPQAGLYGADAIGGVVNIVTKRGKGPLTTTVFLEGGSLETHREQVSLSGSVKQFDYALGASAYESGGQFKNDDSEQYGLHAKLGLRPWTGASITGTARYTKSSTDLPVNDPIIATRPFFLLDPDAQQQNELTVIGAEFAQKLAEWDEIRLRFGQMWQERGFQDPLTAGLDRVRTITQVNNRRREVELVNHLKIEPWTTLSVGGEHREEWASSRRSFKKSVDVNSAFAQDEIRLFDRLFLSGGARLEDHETFGTVTTPRAGASLVIKESGSKLRGSWGRGFRAPTLNDLFFPGFGNPDLRPERSESWDAGIEQRFWRDRIRTEFTYFRSSFTDLIQNVRVGGVLTPQNVGRAVTNGLEFGAAVELPVDLGLGVNYTFTEADDLTNRLPLRRVPHHRWNANVTWDPHRTLNLFVQANVVSSQFEAVGFPRNPGYHRLDAGATYRVAERTAKHPSLSLSLRVQNLTDETYSETLGFRAPGINAYLGLRTTY
jgi:vitamin B12 transporter